MSILVFLPLVFKNPSEYEQLALGDKMSFSDVRHLIESGAKEIPVFVNGREIILILDVSERQRKELLAGGTLNYVKTTVET